MSVGRKLAWASVAMSGVALGMTLFNVATWPRGRRNGRMPGGARVSVLIPARDEEATIEGCVRAVLASGHPIAEVIVCDDKSEDDTAAIVTRLSEEDARVRLIRGVPLEAGWVGKAFACHQLTRAARGEVFLFVDADTRLEEEGVERLASLFAELGADVVTAVPRQETRGWFERLILPLLHVTYTSWFPLVLTWRSQDVRFLAANGQVLAITRRAYEETGGYEAVKGEMVDDMALCRLIKGSGRRVVFADGHEVASCRMYGSAGEVWRGFSKNLYPGIGARPAALAGVLGLYTTSFILPYFLLFSRDSATRRVAALGVAQNVALRGVLAARHGHAAGGVLTHPVGVLGLLGIALNSARWYHTGKIAWRGRSYDHRQISPTTSDLDMERTA